MINSIQLYLEKEVKRVKALDSGSIKLLASDNRLKRQLHLRSGDSQEVEDLKYRLYGAVTEKHRPETILKSPQ